MLGSATNELEGKVGLPAVGGGEKSALNLPAPAGKRKDISTLMSEIEIVPPRPVASSPASGRTPSPKLEAVTKARVDQMDALPPGVRTPRKTNSMLPSSSSSSAPRRTVELEPLPRLADVSDNQWPKLFTKKILQCEHIFDFSAPLLDVRNKELKSLALADILVMVSEHCSEMSELQYQETIVMFAKNVFRAIPPSQNPVGEAFDPEDDDPVYDLSWPHTQAVYEVFIRLVESSTFNVNIARKHIDQLFVYRLLTLFDVEDPREREMVKTAVHRVYGKFLNLRAFIRRSMRNVFYEFLYEGERHNIAEILEILGSVVNGFAVPLRDEHKIFLERTLIPLHKSRYLPVYFSPLSLCILQFAEKDSALVEKIIMGLLRLWPKTNTAKEVMFLNEIEEVLDVTPEECFPRFIVPLCQQLAICIASTHFQVAERALNFWNNEYIVGVIAQNSEAVMPVVLPTMLRHSREHWNKSVQLQVFNGVRLFMDMNPRLYERLSNAQQAAALVPVPPKQHIDYEGWAQIEALARRNSEGLDETKLIQERDSMQLATTHMDVSPSTGRVISS